MKNRDTKRFIVDSIKMKYTIFLTKYKKSLSGKDIFM